MQRRDFILKSGTFLAATILLTEIGGIDQVFTKNASKAGGKKKKRPNPDSFSQPILKAIAIGINAPSPHNTQSWKFKIIDDYSMLLFVDESRFLPATDPTQRQIHMGAGCFIETLRIGASGIGYEVAVEYFPEGYATSQDFGKKPVAKITLSRSSATKDDLAGYVFPRQTNRKAYEGAMITVSEFELVMKAIGKTHAQINFVSDSDKIKSYQGLLIKSMEIESYKFDTHDESRKMMRFSEKERAEKRDGLSIPQVGFSGIMVPIAEMSLKGGEKAWHSKKSIKRHMNTFSKAVNSAKGIITLTTKSNEIIDWVKTGEDFARLGLALTKFKISNNPHTQITQEYEEMVPLIAELNSLENIQIPGKVQLILRVGRAADSYFSYRRNMDGFLLAAK